MLLGALALLFVSPSAIDSRFRAQPGARYRRSRPRQVAHPSLFLFASQEAFTLICGVFFYFIADFLFRFS